MALSDMDGLVIQVGADISPYEDQLQQLAPIAQQTATSVNATLDTMGGAASSASQGLISLDDALNRASAGMDNLSDSSTRASSSISDTGDAAEKAKTPIEDLGHAAHGGGEEAGYFAEGLAEMGKGIIGALALAELIDKMKEFSEAALEAAATEERFMSGMTVLTGGAETAAEGLEQVRELALQMAVPLDDLLHSFQALVARGMDFEQVTRVMQEAQDTAVATGNSFDGVVMALERVYTTGQLQGRGLMQLGLTWEQLAESAGKSVAEIQATMAKGGATAQEQLDILLQAMEKFKGAGAAAAVDLGGAWTRFKNSMSEDMGVIGEKMAGFGRVMADLAPMFQVLGFNVANFGAAAKKAAEDATSNAHQAASGLQVWTSSQEQLDYALGAAMKHLDDVKAAYDRGLPVQAEYAHAQDAVNAAWKAADPLGFAQHMQSVADSNRAAAQAAKDVAEQTKLMQKAIEDAAVASGKVSSDVEGIGANWNKFQQATKDTGPTLQAVEALAAGFEKDLEASYKHWLELTPEQLKAVGQLQQLHDSTVAWADVIKLANQHIQDHAKGVVQATTEYQSMKTTMDYIGLTLKDFNTQQAAFNKLVEQFGDDWKNKVALTLEAVDKAWQDIARQTGSAVQASQTLQTEYDKLTNANKNNLGVLQQIYTSEVQHNATLESQQKTLTDILTLKEKMGIATDSEKLALADINLKLQQQKDQTTAVIASTTELARVQEAVDKTMQSITDQGKILVDVWNGMTQAFSTAFHSLSTGIAQSIVEGKSFSDAWHSIVKKLAEDIITTLVEGALKEMLYSLITNTNFLTNMSNALSGMLQSFTNVTKAATDTASTVNQSANSAMTSISGVASGALQVIDTISGIVTAVFGALSYFTERHMAADLTKIEKSTRYTEIYTGEQSDSILATVHLMLEAENKMVDSLKSIDTAMSSLDSKVKSGAVTSGTSTAGTGSTTTGTLTTIDSLLVSTANTINELSQLPTELRDPWQLAMRQIEDAMSGVQNQTIRDALATATFQALVQGDLETATRALLSAGYNLDQAAAIINNIAPQPTPIINPVFGTPNFVPGVSGTSDLLAQITPPGGGPSGAFVGGAGSGGAPTVSVTITAGTVVGSNGMQQLSQMVSQAVVNQLRGVAGLKL